MSKPNPALVGLVLDNRSVKEVIDDVNAMIKASGLMPDGEEFGCSSYPQPETRMWPMADENTLTRWVACFPVRGGSEAYWVHIHQIIEHRHTMQREAPLMALEKVWEWETATKMASIAAEIFAIAY